MTQPNTTKPSPTRFTLLLAVLGLLALANGCTMNALDLPDTSSRSSGGRSSSGGSASDDNPSGGAPAEEGPVTVPFDKLVVQTVQWFDKDVTIEKAETTTETVESWFGETYAERGHSIGIKIQNRTRFASYIGNQHWDLFLADGTRLDGTTSSMDFGPQDALLYTFWFEDKQDRSLDGAYMELNGSTYGEYKTLLLPLDVTVVEEPALILNDLMGHVFDIEADATSGWQYEIVAAQVGMNSDAHDGYSDGERALVGKKLVDLVVRTTAINATSNLFDDVFHVLVNGSGVSTESSVNEVPEVGEPIDIPVVFQIDENATEFDLEVDTDLSLSRETWSTFHVDLANATPAE